MLLHDAGRRFGLCAARALLVLPCLAPGACASAPDPQPLRVMSYNIAAGNGDLAAIADVIRTAGADIVALQEVDVHWSERSGFVDQAATLAEALGLHVRFGPIYRLPGADSMPAREFGLAILSRDSIVEFSNHVIPRLSTQADETGPSPMPGFLEAVVRTDGRLVHVFNTHLDYRADPRVREQQVAAMIDVVKERAAPLILMGDLNALPESIELQPLLTRFRDAWRAGTGAGFTYPAAAPDRRIDYILLSDHFRVVDVRVPATEASDHRPVLADVLLN
jgi:endonuclease/exonuclease/phosphatase family metal-dependent hydrolase